MCKENEIIQKDIKSISEWLNTSLDNLQIDYQIESMENYKNQAIEMLGTFDEFPKDERRMNKILKMLKNGEKPMPIYVEKDDPHNFIMEGRHRIVAFYLMGFKDVEVARCSLRIENKNKLNP